MKLFYFSFILLCLALLAHSGRRAVLAWRARAGKDMREELRQRRVDNLTRALALLSRRHRVTNDDIEHLFDFGLELTGFGLGGGFFLTHADPHGKRWF